MTLSHKEITKHFRNRLKINGVKARVRMLNTCGDKVIQVNATEYGKEFTEDEQRIVRQTAVNNGFTLVNGLPIDVEQMTNPYDFNSRYNV